MQGLSALASVMSVETFTGIFTTHRQARNGGEQLINLWSAYFKFNNGRFFANAEYDWVNIDMPSMGLYPGQGPHIEEYHSFVELGMMCGPAKLAGMWAQSSGPVKNNWSSGDLNATAVATLNRGYNPKTYSTWAIDWQVLDPYQYLMFGVYCGGNQVFNGLFLGDDGKGMMSDAFAFAGSLDYAVAANLNVWGSYMWAHRLEKYGTYMGQYLQRRPRHDCG